MGNENRTKVETIIFYYLFRKQCNYFIDSEVNDMKIETKTEIVEGEIHYEILLDGKGHQGTYSFGDFIEEFVDLKKNMEQRLLAERCEG